MHQCTVAGMQIAYLDTGAGRAGTPTFLFLHGLGTYGLSWRHNIEALRAHGRCVALDLPGHGLSSRTGFSFSMKAFAHVLLHFIGQLGLENVVLIGHSMGGQIAMTAVLEEPRCAERLVLCAPAGFETFNPFEQAAQQASARMMDVFYDNEATLRGGIHASFHHFPHDGHAMVDDLLRILRSVPKSEHRHAMERCISAMMEGSVFQSLHRIQQPALVIFGEKDALIPAKVFSHQHTRGIAEQGTRRLPHATLKFIPQTGHFVHWEKAREVNSLVTNWLKKKA